MGQKANLPAVQTHHTKKLPAMVVVVKIAKHTPAALHTCSRVVTIRQRFRRKSCKKFSGSPEPSSWAALLAPKQAR
jgi:hypothetical protein